MRQVGYGDYEIPTELRTHLLKVAHEITNDYTKIKKEASERRRDSILFHYERTWKGFNEVEPMHPMDLDYNALEHDVEALSGLKAIYLHDNSRSWLSLEIANVTSLMEMAVNTNDSEWFAALGERYDTLLRALFALDNGWALYNASLAVDNGTEENEDE